MDRTALFLSLILLKAFAWPVPCKADETFSGDEAKKPAVSVQCQGQLRHGIVSIGGETTGTTISFHRITWELQFAEDKGREFAAQHHKKPVLVAGTLRKVAGTEKTARWIIDVEKISAVNSRDAEQERALITVRGTLRAALSTGDVPDLSVRTKDQIWRLDCSASPEIQAAAESLITQPVLITGAVLPRPDEAERKTVDSRNTETLTIRVRTVEARENAEADSRFSEQ